MHPQVQQCALKFNNAQSLQRVQREDAHEMDSLSAQNLIVICDYFLACECPHAKDRTHDTFGPTSSPSREALQVILLRGFDMGV